MAKSSNTVLPKLVHDGKARSSSGMPAKQSTRAKALIQPGGSPQSPYRLEFELIGLPKSPNQLLGAHWTIRSGHAKKWKKLVGKAVEKKCPPTPLEKAKVTLIRYSAAKSMDRDNLRSSFKPIVDALKLYGVIVDDAPEVIGEPVVEHMPGGRGAGKVKIIVESINSPKGEG